MGWDFEVKPSSKSNIIAQCLTSTTYECITQSLQGNELWAVMENKVSKVRSIVLFLLASKDGCWGYKDIGEVECPHYFKCPLSFLPLAPVTNQNWRNSVIDYHNQTLLRKRILSKLSVHKVVALDVPSNEFVVTHLKPFQGISLKDGQKYRLVKSRVVGIRMA